MRILFIVPYPEGKAPSQRFRFEHYFEDLRKLGFQFKISSFFDNRTWDILYKQGNLVQKIIGLIRGYGRRWRNLLECRQYDFVFIHREFSPFGPPILLWILTKISTVKIIYDFDDAIWIPNYSESNSFTNYFKRFSNVKTISRWAYKVSCGNDYLCNFAKLYNSRVVYNPTVIDTEHQHNRIASTDKHGFVIGWTGSHSTIRYLNDIFPVIQELERKFRFEFRVISDSPPELSLSSLKFIPWKKETEIADLLEFTVGIMPLKDDQWAQGKCGFKALQYLSLGIPALVSPVGVNFRIVDHEVNGFHCRTDEDWKQALVKCMTDQLLLKRLSGACRPKIVNEYSVSSNRKNFLHLFD